MSLEKSWRWFGDGDAISLNWIRQMGIQGVVTSLYEVPPGNSWDNRKIGLLNQKIRNHGLRWNVVESLPVSEGIKTHNQEYERHIENYIKSIKALSEHNIRTVCYNFMPVLDWARTDLVYRLPNGSLSMQFDYSVFAAFDIYILNRHGARKNYDEETLSKAEAIIEKLTEEQQNKLAHNIIVVTQGFIHGNVKDSNDYKSRFLDLLEQYLDIDKTRLRENLKRFLDDILPYAEQYGIKMAIHPDDPPFSLLGLPRIVSTSEDLDWIFSANKSDMNGLTLCTGSFSVGDEDVLQIASEFSEKIYFAHLRNNEITGYRKFHESGHIDGVVDMTEIVRLLLSEQVRRADTGKKAAIPMRADHGLSILQDGSLNANPGYPLYGRMKGMAELKGLETAVTKLVLN